MWCKVGGWWVGWLGVVMCASPTIASLESLMDVSLALEVNFWSVPPIWYSFMRPIVSTMTLQGCKIYSSNADQLDKSGNFTVIRYSVWVCLLAGRGLVWQFAIYVDQFFMLDSFLMPINFCYHKYAWLWTSLAMVNTYLSM